MTFEVEIIKHDLQKSPSTEDLLLVQTRLVRYLPPSEDALLSSIIAELRNFRQGATKDPGKKD